MADANLALGGTAKTNYWQCAGAPQLYGPPYGHGTIGELSPHFDAHADGVMISPTKILSLPVKPSKLELQRNTIAAAKLGVGDSLTLVYLPVNHYADVVRFDVSYPDTMMAGATGMVTAFRTQWDTATNAYVTQEIPDVTAAATAQGVSQAIPLDVPSSNVIFLNAGINGEYFTPLYNAPLLTTSTDAQGNTLYDWRQDGAIHFALKIVAMPTNTNYKIENMKNAFHMVVRAHGFDCQDTV